MRGQTNAVPYDVVRTSDSQTIDGRKTFTDPILLKASSTSRVAIGKFHVNDTYMGCDITSGSDGNNEGGLRIVFDKTNGTVSLQIEKTINGQWSAQVIHTF